MAITINGKLIIDEAASVQTSTTDNDTGVAAGSDNEVAWSFLLANMSSPLQTELTTLGILPSTGEAAGDTSAVFPQAAARTIGSSSTDFIQLDTTTVTDLQFSATDGTATGIYATGTGAQIFLYEDSNNHILLGREGTSSDGGVTWTASATGTVAFAVVLDETMTAGDVSGGNVWTIQYEALKHPNTSGVDDADTLDLSGLVNVNAFFTTTTQAAFGDFSHVPSGQDAWSAIEQTGTAGTDTSDPDMVVSGLAPGSTVNVSTQGLGNNAQAVGPGGGVRVDIVNHVNYPDFPLTNTDVHDLSKLSYTSHVAAVTEASFSLTQVNPGNANTTAAVHIWAFNETGDLQGSSLFSAANVGSTGLTGSDQTLVPILGSTIVVYSDLAKTTPVTAGITITAVGDGSWIISGLKVNYTVDFGVSESSQMDRFVVGSAQPTSGSGSNISFDLGNFAFSVTSTASGHESLPVGGDILFEDDGPTISPTGAPVAMEVTERALSSGALTPPSGITTHAEENFAPLFSTNYGADGAAAANPLVYSLTADLISSTGLTDTLSGAAVVLVQTDATHITATAGAGGFTVFTVSVDATGLVSFDLDRSVKQAIASNPDGGESVSLNANLITLNAKATDGDGDSATAHTDVGKLLTIDDDGPTIAPVNSAVDFTHDHVAITGYSLGTINDSTPLPGLGENGGADGLAHQVITEASGLTADGSVESALIPAMQTAFPNMLVTGIGTDTVTYYNDTDGDHIFQSGEGVFQLHLNGDDTYTFTVLHDVPLVTSNLDFSTFKSGAPTESLSPTAVGTGDVVTFDGLVFGSVGGHTTALSGISTKAAALTAYDDNGAQATNDDQLNPDAVGFGVRGAQASQMNNNEGFFATAHITNSGGADVPMAAMSFDLAWIGNQKNVNIEFVGFKADGSRDDDLTLTATNVTTGKTTAFITSIGTNFDNVGVSSGKDNVHLTFTDPDANLDTLFVRFSYDGDPTNKGVRAQNFSVTVPGQFPDQQLPFQVKDVDGDGDSATANLTVGIDGNHDGLIHV